MTFRTGVALLLVACVPEVGPQPPADPVAAAPLLPYDGLFEVEFDVRGLGVNERHANGLGLIGPDEGEACVPSLGSRNHLTNSDGAREPGVLITYEADEVPIPPDVGVGSILPMLGAAPDEVPPLFWIDGVDWAWVGGEWEVLTWDLPRFELALRDGQTCEFRDWALQLDTCAPDAGRVAFDPFPDTEPFELPDRAQPGSGDRWPAPGGGFLCDTYHHPKNNGNATTTED
jgi:hypothetical protein